MERSDVILRQEARTAREVAEMARSSAITRTRRLLADLEGGPPRATYARVHIGDLSENLATLQAYQTLAERLERTTPSPDTEQEGENNG